MPELQDDAFWAKLVIDQLEQDESPSSISYIEERLASHFKPRPQGHRLRPMVERALRRLKTKGKVVYEWDWSGWALEDWDVKRARKKADAAISHREEVSQFCSEETRRWAAHFEQEAVTHYNRLAAQRGLPLLEGPQPYRPKGVVQRDATLADKLEAKAASTTFPHEAAALRAKAAQLRARG